MTRERCSYRLTSISARVSGQWSKSRDLVNWMPDEVHRFPIDPIERFARQSGTRQPVELTSFSFDGTRTLHHDDSSLAYYWPISNARTSLSNKFENLVSRDESINEHLDALLESLMKYETSHGTSKTNVDIVTWRGMITKFLACPFARKDGFEMNVTRLENTIYLEEYTSPKARADKMKRESDHRQRLMGYWGYRYEALATIPHTWHETSRSEIDDRDECIVNTNIQYCSVVRTRLGPVSMILGGEVDCCFDYKPESTFPEPLDPEDEYSGMRPPHAPAQTESIVDQYIELKTSKVQTSDRDRLNFERFKLLKFWAQSFLLGIPRIIVGYRDDDGRILYEEALQTLKIPSLVRASSGAWDGNVCLNFAGEVLAFVKATVMAQPEGIWRIKYVPGSPAVEVYKLNEAGHEFLTEDYIRHKTAIGH